MDVLWVIGAIIVSALPLALSMWALLDAARRPEWAFALAGRSRTLWVSLCAAGILFCLPGVAIAIVYLWRIRPVIAAAEAGDIA